MSIRSMMKDKVTLVKKDGTTVEDIQCSVQSNKIFIADGSIAIEEGDRLVRKLPNRLDESFVVEDRGFFSRHGSSPEHYETKVRREGTHPRRTGNIVYQAVGANARINIGSQDNSANVVTITKDNVFSEIKNALSSQVEDPDEREKLLSKVDEMNEAKKSDGFLAKYQEFMALAANHMTLLAPFIPAFTAYLTR